MIVDRRVPVSRFLSRCKFRVAVIIVYSSLVVILDNQGYGKTLPAFIPAILGTVLSILLGFRTNSAYGRWWEARKIWGAIVNDSRSFTRQCLTLLGKLGDQGSSPEEIGALRKELIYRQMAWNTALNRKLRGQEPWDELAQWLEAKEIQSLKGQSNACVALLQTQAERLRIAQERGDLDVFRWMKMDSMLTRFSDHMGMCERIKSTTFPTTYSNLVNWGIWIFYFMIPPGLASALGWITVPVALLLGGLFTFMEITSTLIQDPFENEPSDTAMTAICRTIEINLREQLGETDLPPALKPIDGILM